VLIVRSWPADPPPGHPRVEDGIARVITPGFDYRPLCSLDGDVLHLDWDTACSLEDLQLFAKAAGMYPDRPLVAPMREYPGGLHGTVKRQLTRPVWNIKRYVGGQLRECGPGDGTCHLFGFGMVYLPGKLLAAHLADLPADVALTDIGFSGWYSQLGDVSTDICWDVAPVHLNYPPPGWLP
jgi:hypothetical protein